MIIGVTGWKGRLGSCLVDKYYNTVPLECDITDEESIKDALGNVNPDVVINCAAVTDVDGCEQPEIYARALKVNGRGPGVLRDVFGGYLVHLSTDYVFDGKHGPYDENAKPNPISSYGWSKWMGEQAVGTLTGDKKTLIVRTTVLFGGDKPDFVTGVLDHLKSGGAAFPSYLYGSPTYVPHLAEGIINAIEKRITGIINIAGSRTISRFKMAKEIATAFGYDHKLITESVALSVGGAPRPKKAGLKTSKAVKLGIPIYDYLAGVKELAETK